MTKSATLKADGVADRWRKLRRVRPAAWLLVGLVGFLGFPWCPMALRWPLRGLILVAGMLAIGGAVGRIREAVPARRPRAVAGSVAVFSGAALVALTAAPVLEVIREQRGGRMDRLSSTVSLERVNALREELEKRGVELAVFALPEFRHVFQEQKSSRQPPLWLERFRRERALDGMRQEGIEVLDLRPLFEEHAASRSAWEDDEIHLERATTSRIAQSLAGRLETLGWEPPDLEGRKIILMGNCFAGQFAEEMRKNLPDWGATRGLTALGDRGRVANQLFLFPEEYLAGVRTVVWVMSYDLLTAPALPPLSFEPRIDDEQTRKATIRLDRVLGWDREEGERRLPDLPYPDALVEVTGRVWESEHFPRESTVLAVGPGIENRELLALGRMRSGKLVRLNLLPFESVAARDREIARAYVVNPGEEFHLDRYWIHSWTIVR